jgi:nucleoid DNA-binding protein
MLKDKHPLTPIKDHLIKYVVEETGYNEGTVEAIIDWVTKDTRDATQIHKTIELSGWGTLKLHTKKITKKITGLENFIIKHTENKEMHKRVEAAMNVIEELNKKK